MTTRSIAPALLLLAAVACSGDGGSNAQAAPASGKDAPSA